LDFVITGVLVNIYVLFCGPVIETLVVDILQRSFALTGLEFVVTFVGEVADPADGGTFVTIGILVAWQLFFHLIN
jgi:hypothetical protein